MANPGAETGNLSDWTGAVFGVAQYGSSPSVPSQAVASYNGLGSWLFRGEQTGATLTQEVSVGGFASQIDAGGQQFTVWAVLGGASSRPDGMELLMQPKGASDEPLGPPVQLGPPTATDREDQATMLACSAMITAPIGMRSALITLLAAGDAGATTTADADNVELIAVEPGGSAVVTGASGPAAQGPNCFHKLLPPVAPIATLGPPIAPNPAPSVLPCDGCGVEQVSKPVKISHLRLTDARLSLSLSSSATVDVAIEREGHTVKSAKRVRSKWRAVLHLTLHAKSAGFASYRLHRLEAGRYRVIATVVGSTEPVAVTTQLRR